MSSKNPVLTVLRGGRLEIAPDQADALVRRAAARSLAGDLEGALADYAAALELARARSAERTDACAQKVAREFLARIHCDRAATYMRIGVKGDAAGFDRAAADCDEALRLGHATPVMLSWQKSQILFAAGRYEEAAAIYGRAIALDSGLKRMGSHARFCRTFEDLNIPIAVHQETGK